MSNRRDIQFLYNPHNKATMLDCQFTVDSTNVNGLGISSLNKSGRIANVFMKTSATPASGNTVKSTGGILVQLQDNYNTFYNYFAGWRSPQSGSDISISGSSVMTIGSPYVITSLGTSTAANWHSVGVPANITPAVNVAFFATVTGSGTGTGKVQAPATAGANITNVELVGSSSLANSQGALVLGAGVGMQIIFQCFKNGALAAPADGTILRLNFYMNNSAQGV